MLKVTHLVHRYPDGRRFLTALSVPHLEAYDGEAWCITGPSGSGKSTFLHCLSGLLRPTEGDISYKGRSLPLICRTQTLMCFGAAPLAASIKSLTSCPFFQPGITSSLAPILAVYRKRRPKLDCQLLQKRWASCTFFPITPMN